MGINKTIPLLALFLLVLSAFVAAGQVVAEGEAWKVGTSTKKLELGENADEGANSETIAQIVNFQFIDDTEMPSLLRTYTANNPKGDAPYDQRLYFEDNSTGYVGVPHINNSVGADFLQIKSGSQIARYELEFTTSLESDVDDSSGSRSTSGLYLTDFENTELEILGKQYGIVVAKRISPAGNSIELILMGGAVRDTLTLGTTKTYTIDGRDFEVTLDFVDGDSAKFTINGETTADMLDGEFDELADGVFVGVSEILFQDFAGGVHSAEFYLGAQQLVLRDDNIADTVSTHNLTVNGEEIHHAKVTIEGTDDNSTFKIDKISVNMTAQHDYRIPAGGKLSENPELQQPQVLFTQNWDIEYQGLSEEPINVIEIQPRGTDDYDFEFVDTRGNKAKVPIANAVSGNNLKFGDDDDNLIINENKVIHKDDYFFVSNWLDDNGDRASFALRYRGADKSTDDSPVLKFDDMGSGERLERPVFVSSITSSSEGFGGFAKAVALLGTIKIGGATFNVYNASSHLQNDFDVFIDLNGDGTLQTTASDITLNTQYGAEIKVVNDSDKIHVSVDTPNRNDYDDLNPSPFNFDITADSGEVRLEKTPNTVHEYVGLGGDPMQEIAYSSYGSSALLTSFPNNPGNVVISYPQNQRLPQVFITGKDVSFVTIPDEDVEELLELVAGLQNQIVQLQNQVDSLNQRTSILESWKISVTSMLNEIKSWLFFSSHNDVCHAAANCENTEEPEIECHVDSDCNGWREENNEYYCFEGDVWERTNQIVCNNPATEESFCGPNLIEHLDEECDLGCENGECLEAEIECHDDVDCEHLTEEPKLICMDRLVVNERLNIFCSDPGTVDSQCIAEKLHSEVEECDFGCEDGACLDRQEPSFLTNVENGEYYNSQNSWIAVDKDKDGYLEAYGLKQKADSNNARCSITELCTGDNAPCLLLEAPTGEKVVDYNHPDRILVCDTVRGQVKQVFYDINDPDAEQADLN